MMTSQRMQAPGFNIAASGCNGVVCVGRGRRVGVEVGVDVCLSQA
jgi:hypothetical protein